MRGKAKERFLVRLEMTIKRQWIKNGFPIQAFGNDRGGVIHRSLEIVGNDRYCIFSNVWCRCVP